LYGVVGFYMAILFINFAKKGAGFSPCVASGSITGESDGLVGITREFYPEAVLVEELDAAGIAEHRYKEPLRFVQSGYGGSSLEISAEEGIKLRVLERER